MYQRVFALRRRFVNVLFRTETLFFCQPSVKMFYFPDALLIGTSDNSIRTLQSTIVGTMTRLWGRVRKITITSTEGAIDFCILQSIKTVSGAHATSYMVGTEETLPGVKLLCREAEQSSIECRH
jgi:hypothetical protein